MTATPTAATPEELAARLAAISPAAATFAAEIVEIFAERDQDQRAEIERLTDESDQITKALREAVDDVLKERARATTAEAALAAMTAERDASLERERGMREALKGVIGMAENFLELHLMSKAAKDPDIVRARAAIAKEATDVR